MPHEELITGLKNALDRGQSLENAVQSLISAGYNLAEVHDAADSINLGAIGEVSKQEIKNQISIPTPESEKESSDVQYKPLPRTTAIQSQPKQHRKIPRWLINLLIFVGALIVFIILVNLLGSSILNAFFK